MTHGGATFTAASDTRVDRIPLLWATLFYAM
jgi:hypothetical protein